MPYGKRKGRACWVTLTGNSSPAETAATLLAWNTTSLTTMTGDVAATTWTHQPAVSATKAAGAAPGCRLATLRAKARARTDPAHDSAPRRGPYGECARPDGQSAAVASAIVTSATASADRGRRPARREAARATS